MSSLFSGDCGDCSEPGGVFVKSSLLFCETRRVCSGSDGVSGDDLGFIGGRGGSWLIGGLFTARALGIFSSGVPGLLLTGLDALDVLFVATGGLVLVLVVPPLSVIVLVVLSLDGTLVFTALFPLTGVALPSSGTLAPSLCFLALFISLLTSVVPFFPLSFFSLGPPAEPSV